MYKLDLHTHSVESADGSISIEDYKKLITSKKVDYVAITDHNSLDYALRAKEVIGSAVIVGEEIMTTEGEIIGLYLKEKIKPNQSLEQTIDLIKKQDGLVYVPHPLDITRKGIGIGNLNKIKDEIDIVECYNSRSISILPSKKLKDWVSSNNLACASSSDSHGKIGYGRTFTVVSDKPTRSNLVKLLSEASYYNQPATLVGRLYPSLNRKRKVSA